MNGRFSFPQWCIEGVDIVDAEHIVVLNDNNLTVSASREFDLALLDISIGGHSVRPFAAHVRHQCKPMLFVTGSRELVASGEAVVYKPFSPDELQRGMTAVLQHAGSEA